MTISYSITPHGPAWKVFCNEDGGDDDNDHHTQHDLRMRGVDPDGDRLTFGVTGPDAQLVRLEQQGDNQVGS